MRGFYITKIVVSGSGLSDSIIELKDGVNIIYGPSNTGKTYIIRSIDYLFGSDNLPIDDSSHYDMISIHFRSRIEGGCVISRKLKERKVTVSDSTIKKIENGEYTTSSVKFKQIYLTMIGIEENVKLVAKQDYSKTQKLSWRMLLPMFFIQEEHIFRSDSIITSPGFNNITVALSALKYCYDGKQVELPDKGDVNAAAIGRQVVVAYISRQVQRLKEEKQRLKTAIAASESVDIGKLLSKQAAKLEQLNQETQKLSEQNKKILLSKIALTDKLHELEYIQNRFSVLATGYQSDIERLEFIIDGEEVLPQDLKRIICPFCSGQIKSRQHKSLIESAKKELYDVKIQLKELQTVMVSNDEEMQKLQNKLVALKNKQNTLALLIDTTYKIQITETQRSISNLEMLQRMNAKLDYIEEISKVLNTDIQAYEAGKETTFSYDAKVLLGDVFYDDFNKYLEEALRTCKYDCFMNCYLSKSEFDIVIDGKRKRNQGKGYRAFLNTVMAYCILQLLSIKGTYSPGLLILDSPILSLKEKNEQTSAEMKENLFRMILNTEFSCQIIIAENDIPSIDYSKANMIHFTKEVDSEHYGFLKEI